MGCQLEAVAFDIDGTIYPEWRFHLLLLPFLIQNWWFMRFFGRVRKELRQRQKKTGVVSLDFFDEQAGLLAGYLGRDKAVIKRELQEKIYEGWKPVLSRVKPYKHVVEVVAQLKQRGFKIALLSDFLIEQKSDVWGILPFCDVALGSEKVGALKPSKHPFLALSTALKLQPEKILYVGNNVEYDVKGANAVGMRTAIISRQLFSFLKKNDKTADIVFSDYRQLLDRIIAIQENKCWF